MNRLTRFLVLACVVVTASATDVYFSETIASGSESTATTPIVLTVNRTPATGPLTVNFTTLDTVSPAAQRADIGSDYTLTPGLTAAPAGVLNFVDGEASKTLTLTILPDADIEGRQFVRLTLASGSYNIVGLSSSVQVTIGDDDLVATVVNDSPLASEDPNLNGHSYDPDDARRGVMRVAFSSTSTFDKSVQAVFAGTALLGTDYLLSYKIGGSPIGAGLGFTAVAYPKGDTDIDIAGTNVAIGAGDTVRFADDPTKAYTVDAYAGGTGTLKINSSGGLLHKLHHGVGFSINGSASSYTVARTFVSGTTTIAVADGQGLIANLSVGDVFYFVGGTARYVVTTALTTNGALVFRRYAGGTSVNTGLDLPISTNTPIQTVFQTSANPLVVLVPKESLRVDYGITPGNGTTSNDSLVEGREFVTLAVSTNPDYELGDPSTGGVTIGDFDPTASVALTSNAVERDTPGTFTVSLTPPINHPITVGYTISGTAAAGLDYTTLTGEVVIPATGSGTITVQPLGTAIPVGGQTVIVTLKDSPDYHRADGVLTASTATMTILPTTGTISVASTTQGTEGGSDGAFTVTLVRYAGHAGESVTIGYSVSSASTAIAGSDYTALSGTVTIPAGALSLTATIPVLVTNDSLAETDETVAITLSAGSSYKLVGATTATVTIHDDEPTISVLTPVNATEGGTPGSFTIGYPLPARSVAYPVTFVLSGTATSGTDYTTTTPTTVTIPLGFASIPVTITAVDNAVAYTPAQQVTLTITPPGASGTFHVGTAAQTLSIVENEPGASVATASGATATEGGANAVFTITLTSVAPAGGLTIPYTFSGASSTNYTATPPDKVVVAAGALIATVTIAASDNVTIDAARNVTLTLTAPAAPASYFLGTATASLALADNDTSVTSVSSPAINGTYELGDNVPITVTFLNAVTVTGTPTLALATTPTTRQAVYASGSGSATLTFTYVVEANDTSSDLDYTATTALSGTITPTTGTAVLTLPAPGAAGSLAANKALRIDGGLTGGKPAPGVVSNGGGGGCGLGSGFAALASLFMLAGFALSVRRNRA